MTVAEQMCAYITRHRALVLREVGGDYAEDNLQSCCLACCEAAATRHIEYPLAYAAAILRHHLCAAVAEKVKGRRAVNIEEMPMLPDPKQNPERACLEAERQRLVRGALVEMPQGRGREVLLRSWIAEEPQDRTCIEMGLTSTQYRLHKSRAKASLTQKLKRRLRLAA